MDDHERELLRKMAEGDRERAAFVECLTKACGGLFCGFKEEGFSDEQAFELTATYLQQTVANAGGM